jgi:hypothetical protein
MNEIRNSNLLGKFTVVLVVCFLVMVILCVNTALALDGSGTLEDPWLIQSLEDFNDFAADANYWDDYTRLETDVNLAGMVYERAVIGDIYYDGGWIGTVFSGVFDGNDHKILNLTIDDGGAGNDGVGLFGNIENGEVRNLGLEGGSVSGDRMVGGLVGSTYEGEGTLSNISNCYSTGDVSGDNEIGGLIGSNQASISNCYSTGEVSGEYEIGGLVGVNFDVVRNCFWDIETSGEPNMCGNYCPNAPAVHLHRLGFYQRMEHR